MQWQDRAQFFAMAARLMRRVLIDFARAMENEKRGGALHPVTFDPNLPVASDTPEDSIAIDERGAAIAGGQDDSKAQVVELRFFEATGCRLRAPAEFFTSPVASSQ